ncbi:MAG: hypothetical protein AB3N16_07465 [Flavobacteriaceae bacterium]
MRIMEDIWEYSALGFLSIGYKWAVLVLFTSIISLLLGMLVALVTQGVHMNVQFGY